MEVSESTSSATKENELDGNSLCKTKLTRACEPDKFINQFLIEWKLMELNKSNQNRTDKQACNCIC